MLPDWLWDPADNWARLKGYGRILLFLGAVLYGLGLLGLRQVVERRRERRSEGDDG